MNFLDTIILWSLKNRLVVVIGAIALTIYGMFLTAQMPVDVFPDLTAPTVTVMTEAHGLAPEEVETLVTIPIESVMNGATSVRRVRSSSAIGYSIVWVEFDWDTDIYIARQIVNEKLQMVASQIPPELGPPTLGPISSIMGEIMFVGINSDRHSDMEIRETADWVIRKRILSVSGVAQVIPIGGEVKQFQVIVDPVKLMDFNIQLEDVIHAIEQSNNNSSGGFLLHGAQESLIRGLGRINDVRDIENIVVSLKDMVPVLLKKVATVEIGAAVKLGEGSANGKKTVIMAILKQPEANTLELTRRIDEELDKVELTLPEGMKIERHLFRQSDFIENAIQNISNALRDGAIFVAFILFIFLLNFRTTFISLAAIPLSLLITVIVMKLTGITINTMTLGGLTIAIGGLVDDAIIGVENIFRRLKENKEKEKHEQRQVFDVIFDASREVKSSSLFATLIVMLAFVPIFFLSGVESRLLAPLGVSYIVAQFASLLVAFTLTPALCYYLLPKAGVVEKKDGAVVSSLKNLYIPMLRNTLKRPLIVIVFSLTLLVISISLSFFLGRSFLPDFNEGALSISAVTLPGTSLEESNKMGNKVEEILLSFPEVVSTARKTGRGELDEHALSVNSAEIDVKLAMKDRSMEEFLSELREKFNQFSGMIVQIGQPLSHRIDHMLSGSRASIAVKLFGEDLKELRTNAEKIRRAMSGIKGVVDLSVEQQVDVPQLHILFDRNKIAQFGLRTGELAEIIEIAYSGHVVSQIIDEGRTYDLVVKYPDDQKKNIAAIQNTLIDTPAGIKVPLKMLADIRQDMGPNFISRENAQRKIVIMSNVQGRDLKSVVTDISDSIEKTVALPDGYYVVFGGQFESEHEATRTIFLLSLIILAGIFLLLFISFRSISNTLLIMTNLPLALVGGIISVWLTGGVLNIASIVGFITLFGIATRNGIMLISHYEFLRNEEKSSVQDAVEKGSINRLVPILMTSLTTGLALIPLVLAGQQPGNEIQAPMGIVIIGGLVSSTILNMFVVPTIYLMISSKGSVIETRKTSVG